MFFRTWISSFLSIVISILYVSASAVAQDNTLSNSSATNLLIDAQWLLENNDVKAVRLISLGQTEKQYRIGHIPNSVFVDWKTQISDLSKEDLFNLPPQESIEKLLSSLGVTPEMTVVLSDNRSNRLSSRLFWTLRVYGHRDVKILNGGMTAWHQAGEEFTTSTISVEPTAYKVAAESKEMVAANLVDTPTVRKSLGKNVVLLDGRPEPQYSGEEPGIVFHTNKAHKRRGHIKTAINVPWKANFTKDGKFKSVEALREIYTKAGVTSNQNIVTYCNEGLHAAPAWFVLKELLGFPNVKLYDDSMGVWANRIDTPMQKFETPLD